MTLVMTHVTCYGMGHNKGQALAGVIPLVVAHVTCHAMGHNKDH